MRRLMLASFLAVLVTAAVVAQQSTNMTDETPTVRANTRMVVVDAIITDNTGKPVTDLKPEDIVVEENGKSQKIANVELVTPSNEGLSSLPETIYSNRPEVNA
ncbi:MAG TPA: hypothetical protein VL382_12015, partial [Terriglobales bacterium]|nr:hypothetical protein [Terriglobales bacterium]